MTGQLLSDLGMKQKKGDPTSYVTKVEGIVTGVSGSYVDKLLNARNLNFKRLTNLTLKIFDSEPRFCDSFNFFGAQIKTEMNGSFGINQKYYINFLLLLNLDTDFECFRRHCTLFTLTSTLARTLCTAAIT